MVMDKLKNLGFSETYAHLAKGGFGQVYKINYTTNKQPRAVAVKVSYYKHSKALPRQIKKFNTIFDRTIAKRVAEHKRNNESLDSDLTYFTEEMVLQPVKLKLADETKEFTLQFMELIKGKELYDFLKENTLNLKQVMTIFCSCLHALDFFHDGSLMFNDLKLENVMVDPETFHVTFIDFYDSNTQCTHNRCKENPYTTICTFIDPTHEPGLHEDVFRLGILFLDSMTQICHHRDNNASGGLAGDSIKYELDRNNSTYPTKEIRAIIENTVAAFRDIYRMDESCGRRSADSIISELHNTLKLMLASDISKRPSVRELLEKEPWKLCKGQSTNHSNDKCFEKVPRLTEKQKGNKKAINYLNSMKRMSKKAISSIQFRTYSSYLMNTVNSKKKNKHTTSQSPKTERKLNRKVRRKDSGKKSSPKTKRIF